VSFNNFFSQKYQQPSHVETTLEYVQFYSLYVASGFVLCWYAFFLLATWFGRGFGIVDIQQGEDPGAAGQPCVREFTRTQGHGRMCWLPLNGGGWELMTAEMEPF